jgi:hypothetical protein
MNFVYRNHDAPACAACSDTGHIDDPDRVDEDGVYGTLPCPSCTYASECECPVADCGCRSTP